MTALLFLAAFCSAAEFRYAKQTDAGDLADKLTAAGFAVERVWTNQDGTLVILKEGEAKDPSAIVAAYVHPDVKEAAIISELLTLAPKLKDNTATLNESRRAIFLILKYLKVSKD